jgi:hypothetical protein
MMRHSSPPLALLAACLALAGIPVESRQVTLSNTRLPVDQNGNPVLTGEMTISTLNATHFCILTNNWGGCPGIDCCTSGACASCCFSPPSARYNDTCVYTGNHTVEAYVTDLSTWTYMGPALTLAERLPGIEFRPQLLHRPSDNTWVMWYEDRWPSGKQDGYAVATSPNPWGPFTTVSNSVSMAGSGRIGDYDVFVDEDGTAYHVRTGLTIEVLASNLTAGTGNAVNIPNGGVEGPAMFFRRNASGTKIYYVLVGEGCCACRGGSNIVVYTALSAMGPYTRVGDVGSNTTSPFHPTSPFNYVTRAQQTKVIMVPDGQGNTQYLWAGNQWVTSLRPDGSLGGPRNQDLLYWTVLDFDAAGNIQQVVWQDECTINVQG